MEEATLRRRAAPYSRRGSSRSQASRQRPGVHSTHRVARGALTLDLVRGTALVLSSFDGDHRYAERYSRRFVEQVGQACRALERTFCPGSGCTTCAALTPRWVLAAGEPVKVVSERLGHASATITLTVYQHVHPCMSRQAADQFAALLRG